MKTLLLLTFLASAPTFAETKTETTSTQTTAPETKTIAISGMTCGTCVASIKKHVCEGLKYSAENCQVSIGELKVTGSNIDMAAIKAAVEKGGYEIASTTSSTATESTSTTTTTTTTDAKPAAPAKKKK